MSADVSSEQAFSARVARSMRESDDGKLVQRKDLLEIGCEFRREQSPGLLDAQRIHAGAIEEGHCEAERDVARMEEQAREGVLILVEGARPPLRHGIFAVRQDHALDA